MRLYSIINILLAMSSIMIIKMSITISMKLILIRFFDRLWLFFIKILLESSKIKNIAQQFLITLINLMNMFNYDSIYGTVNEITMVVNIFMGNPEQLNTLIESKETTQSIKDIVIIETIVTEQIIETIVTEPIIETFVTEPIIETIVTEPIIETIVTEPIIETIATETIIDTIVTEPIIETFVTEQIIETIATEPLIETIATEPIIETIVTEQIIETIASEPIIETIKAIELADRIDVGVSLVSGATIESIKKIKPTGSFEIIDDVINIEDVDVSDEIDDIVGEIEPLGNLGHFRDRKYTRCVHTHDNDVNFAELVDIYNVLFGSLDQLDLIDSNERIILGSPDRPIDLGVTKVDLVVPIIFHLVDPDLGVKDVDYWTRHINDNIVNQLNNDYNVTFFNYADTYLENVEKLFKNADPTKRQFYLNLVSTLPNNPLITWKFNLEKVVMNPVAGLRIKKKDNDDVFKAVSLIDPEKFLNIIILPGDNVLGISVFPFKDRCAEDHSKIASEAVYKNGVLIGTVPFIGSVAPFNKYRTFTHEIGHWCGLLHPFDNMSCKTPEITGLGLNKLNFDKNKAVATTGTGTGLNNISEENELDQDFVGDLVSDTPPQTKPTYGTVYDKISTITRRSSEQKITVRNTPFAYIFEKNNHTPNFFNFMDYTDDAQMCMFSHLQIVHMIYMLLRFRPNFVYQYD